MYAGMQEPLQNALAQRAQGLGPQPQPVGPQPGQPMPVRGTAMPQPGGQPWQMPQGGFEMRPRVPIGMPVQGAPVMRQMGAMQPQPQMPVQQPQPQMQNAMMQRANGMMY